MDPHLRPVQETQLSRSRTHGFSPDRLKQARQRVRLTQEDVAVAAGLDPTTISHWETGQTSPGPRQLAAVAQVLGLTPGDFLSSPVANRTLAQLRQQAGLTQGDMAVALGVPATTWGMIERAARTIGDHRTDQVAQLLAISTEDLAAAWQRTRDRRIQHAD